MTVLANALLSIPAGHNIRAAQVVPGGLKQLGVAQVLRVTMDATVFPAGTTQISIGLSTDGGNTFRTASMDCTGPPFPAKFPGVWVMTYELDDDATITNARLETNAPQAFQTQTLIEVL